MPTASQSTRRLAHSPCRAMPSVCGRCVWQPLVGAPSRRARLSSVLVVQASVSLVCIGRAPHPSAPPLFALFYPAFAMFGRCCDSLHLDYVVPTGDGAADGDHFQSGNPCVAQRSLRRRRRRQSGLWIVQSSSAADAGRPPRCSREIDLVCALFAF